MSGSGRRGRTRDRRAAGCGLNPLADFGAFAVNNNMDGREPGQRTHPDAPLRLDVASVDAVALRVVQLMDGGRAAISAGVGMVDAATLAAELGVDRSWVYAHRDELGAVRIGTGVKPRLRFDLKTAREMLARSTSKDPQTTQTPVAASGSPHRRRRRLGSSPGLLPIRADATPFDADRQRS
jgi:hypothetical protein